MYIYTFIPTYFHYRYIQAKSISFNSSYITLLCVTTAHRNKTFHDFFPFFVRHFFQFLIPASFFSAPAVWSENVATYIHGRSRRIPFSLMRTRNRWRYQVFLCLEFLEWLERKIANMYKNDKFYRFKDWLCLANDSVTKSKKIFTYPFAVINESYFGRWTEEAEWFHCFVCVLPISKFTIND